MALYQTAYLKPADYRMKIVLAAAFAVLILGYEAVVVAHIIITGYFGDVWGLQSSTIVISLQSSTIVISALPIAVFTAAICANVWILRHRQRRVQALARRDPSVVTVASPQPEEASLSTMARC